MDELKLVMCEEGVFREYKEPYCVIECPEKEDYDHIVKMVERGEKMRWIPVSERMPDMYIGDCVLVCASGRISESVVYDHAVVMAYVAEDEFWDAEFDVHLKAVTHWMPLPEPPEVDYDPN